MLALMRKIFTGIPSDELYDDLKSERLLPEEQKWCQKIIKTKGDKGPIVD